jgi:hypothetical protein
VALVEVRKAGHFDRGGGGRRRSTGRRSRCLHQIYLCGRKYLCLGMYVCMYVEVQRREMVRLASYYCDMLKFREMSDFDKCEEGGAQASRSSRFFHYS